MLIGPVTQPDYAEQLRSFVAVHGLADAVQILPGLRHDDPDLPNAFHACDVFVLPSRHEPFGIVVLEAWSAGRPVLVNRVGGLQSLVRQDENGRFISPSADATAGDLAGQLEVLAASPAVRAQLGAAGHAEARDRYDWSRIARQLEGLYQAAEAHAARRYGSSA
jgi:glycosyltransferase involved in cell wall biosynthesis